MSDMIPSTGSPQLFPDLPAAIAEGSGRIRPRARLLRTIGAELISSEVVAVIELVRNSYDADATEVELVFHKPEDQQRTVLEIRDNGHGMNRDLLLGPWLEPATDHKHGSGNGGTSGERSPAGRRRLGSKGVGRFAAQRLGQRLELRTRAVDSSSELTAFFNWRLLERDQYLDQVRIPWREHAPENIDRHGTHLRITELRDGWTAERFERLKLGLARLVSPTMKNAFRIRITINGAPEEIRPAMDAEAAMYAIAGKVEVGGLATITYSDINGDKETWERRVYWPNEGDRTCGPFTFRVNAWDLDSEPLRYFLKKTGSLVGLRDFRRLIRDHSGISLYRDGFRILPYGEPDNDWLRLDRRRVNNPTMRLSNNQVLGTIQLTADENPELKDQTNREGLITNEAYEHLQEIVLELLGYLETRRFAARRTMDIDWQRKTTSLPDLHNNEKEDRFRSLFTKVKSEGPAAAEAVEQLELAFDEFRDATADAVRHYAGLASAGQMSGLVFRQLEHPLRQIRSDLSLVLDDLAAGNIDPEDLDDTRESVQRALRHLAAIENRIEKLDPLAAGGRGRRVSKQQLNEVLLGMLDPYEDEFHRLNVVLDFQGDPSVELQSNREIVQQVLANLVDNALYWARQGEASTPTVTVTVTKTGFLVSDNGPGIDEKLKDAIFEPHFTQRPDAYGLGLTLTRDLLKTIGGRIRVSSCRPAALRVELAS